jgi:hypothetical protein
MIGGCAGKRSISHMGQATGHSVGQITMTLPPGCLTHRATQRRTKAVDIDQMVSPLRGPYNPTALELA